MRVIESVFETLHLPSFFLLLLIIKTLVIKKLRAMAGLPWADRTPKNVLKFIPSVSI